MAAGALVLSPESHLKVFLCLELRPVMRHVSSVGSSESGVSSDGPRLTSRALTPPMIREKLSKGQ